jgi:GntR family transcriptional regulator / MocR family aminotransferase
MTLHISLVGRKDLSVEIYRQIRDAIVNRVLRPGDRVPASRELASTLSVSRMTVTVAYERLSAEGFVVSRVGDGTFVSAHAVGSIASTRGRCVDGVLQPRQSWNTVPLPNVFGPSGKFDFRTGIPDAGLFPHTVWQRTVTRTLKATRSEASTYGEPAGDPRLRESIARHLGISRGVTISADDVTVTNGTQQALDVIARALFSPGDRVAVEDPGYWPPRRLFEMLGARVVGVPVDREGLVVRAIPRRVRAVYVTPSHQYPLSVSMTLPRRQALLDWANREDAAILEDDYDSEFRFGDRPFDPLRTLDVAGRVIYIGSFSKTLSPGLRLGFIVAPASLHGAVHRAKFLSDWHSPSPLQAALARFIDDGEFARHLRRAHSVYRERRELIAQILTRDFANDFELIPSSTGLHLTALARTATVDGVETIAVRAWEAGVAVQTLAFAAVRPETRRAGLMLGYGAVATKDIAPGLRVLRGCIRRTRLLNGPRL